MSRRPTHLRALELGYDAYIALNGGEECGLCGTQPKENGRKLHRDHWHNGPLAGRPRGLLCFRCNRQLSYYVSREWLLLAIAYLKRSEDRELGLTHTDTGA